MINIAKICYWSNNTVVPHKIRNITYYCGSVLLEKCSILKVLPFVGYCCVFVFGGKTMKRVNTDIDRARNNFLSNFL